MKEGYIYLHRKIMTSEVFINEKLLKLWIWCLLKASFKYRGSLKAGQFLYGRKLASMELDMPKSTIRNLIFKLISMGLIKKSKDRYLDRSYSIFDIVKYSEYQNPENIRTDVWTDIGQLNFKNKDSKDSVEPLKNKAENGNGENLGQQGSEKKDSNRRRTLPNLLNSYKYSTEDKYSLVTEYMSIPFFEKIWKRYPSPVGKKNAYRHYKANVKNQKDWNDINKALDNYLASERVQLGYIQNGSTWFNNWRDWVEYQEKAKPDKRQKKLLTENNKYSKIKKQVIE